MTAISLAQIEETLKLLMSTNWAGAYQAFRSGNIAGELTTIEDVMKIVGVFIPEVAEAEDAIEVFGLLLRYGTPADADTPLMERASGAANTGPY